MEDRLVAFGCSHTYGHGLPDCYVPIMKGKKTVGMQYGPVASNLAWPKLLANLKNIECDNRGVPGASNKEILYNILNYNFTSNDCVYVLWTYLARWCIIDKDKANKNKPKLWKMHTHKKSAATPMTRAYYTYIFNKFDASYELLQMANAAYLRLAYLGVKSQMHILVDYCELQDPQSWDLVNFNQRLCLRQFAWHYEMAEDKAHYGVEAHKDYAALLHRYEQFGDITIPNTENN